jgi:anaphase-promoting complex subunit 1
VASRLRVPQTLFLLDEVRPDLLMLRVVARSLVMWSDVRPELAWVSRQVPGPVQDAFE